jgi:hypothetical protein
MQPPRSDTRWSCCADGLGALPRQPDEFIDYSVILDVHINWSLEELSPEDQYEFLIVLKEVLESHVRPGAQSCIPRVDTF